MLGVELGRRALRFGGLERLVVVEVAALDPSATSSPVLRTTITVSIEGTSPRNSSTAGLISALLPLRRAQSTVISAFASENCIRSFTAPGEKPPKTTLCGAPIRAQASIETTTSGIIGR